MGERSSYVPGTFCPRAHWLLDLVPAHEQLCVVASVEDAMAAWPGQGLAQAG